MERVNAGSSLASALEEESLSVSFFSRKCSGGIKGGYDGAAARNTASSICNRKSAELRTLHAAGTVLKPKGQY